MKQNFSCGTLNRRVLRKNKGTQTCPFILSGGSGLLSHLSEALAAVDGTIGLGLKGNLRLSAACGADSGKELTRAAGRILACVTAGLAALGLVLEATLCVELLLTGGENEFFATLFAN